MVEKQRRAIKKAALGNTLNLKFKEKLFGPLIVYLIDKVDTEKKEVYALNLQVGRGFMPVA